MTTYIVKKGGKKIAKQITKRTAATGAGSTATRTTGLISPAALAAPVSAATYPDGVAVSEYYISRTSKRFAVARAALSPRQRTRLSCQLSTS